MPTTTPNRGYPYPVDGDPIDIAGDIGDLAIAIDLDFGAVLPGGAVTLTIAAVAPAGWALFTGQTLTGADVAYPALWAVAPAAWKSGANLILPDARGRYLVTSGGAAALGSVGGSNSRTLTTAQMPYHGHGGATASENANHYHSVPDHLHGVNIWSAAADRALGTSWNGNHAHGEQGGQAFIASTTTGGPGSSLAINFGDMFTLYTPSATGGGGDHSHAVTDHLHAINGATGGSDRSLNSGGVSANHQHGVYAEGGGAAFDISPAYFSLNLMIRLR